MPACCPPGSWPQLLKTRDELNAENVDPPLGEIVKKGELDLYVVSPPEGTVSKGSILVVPDIYSVRVLTPAVRSGDRIGNICDTLAQAGYTVCMPSIFGAEPYDVAVCGPDDGDFEKFDSFAQDGGVAWFQKQTYEKVGPMVKTAAGYLSELGAPGGLGILGFCYGTWLLSKSSSTGDVTFDAAVGCHPATVLEKAVFGGDEIAMMKGLKQPTKFLWAGNDSDIYTKDGEGKKALEESGGGVEEFPDMLHGWVSRGDVGDERVQKDVKKAIDMIIGFFDEKMPKA